MLSKTARTPGLKKLNIKFALISCFISSAVSRRTGRPKNSEEFVPTVGRCKLYIETRLSLYGNLGYEFGTDGNVVVSADVTKCLGKRFTDGLSTSCWDVDAALKNYLEEREQVKRNLQSIKRSQACVRYAIKSIDEKSQRSNAG